MREFVCKVLLIFAGLSLFIQFCAVISLQAAATYVFGGAAILFAVLVLLICLAD